MKENKDVIQKHISNIGNTLASIMPDNWDHVIYGFFLAGENQSPHQQIIVMMDGEYVDWYEKNWDNENYDEAIFTLTDESDILHNYCLSKGDDWRSFTMILDHTGSFSVDWGYSRIPRIDTYFVLQWKNQYCE